MTDGVESNRIRLGKMIALVEAALPRFVEERLEQFYGKNWRQHAQFPDGAVRGGRLDMQAYLRLFQNEWREVFSKELGHTARDAATATNAGRNAWAHPPPGADIPDDVTLRGLLGGAELLDAIKAPNAKAARGLADAAITYQASKRSGGSPPEPMVQQMGLPPKRPVLTLTSPPASEVRPEQLGLSFNEGRQVGTLAPWRLTAPPREDITAGRLTLDHFAADLAVVDRGEADGAYGDPIEFFRATHLTGGLRLVLQNGAGRLGAGAGPSVIGLQTNFGGGKTHTMLALLHLLRAPEPAKLQGVPEVVGAAIHGLKGAKTVAFSGTDKGPDQPLIYAGSRAVRTIWGYLAYRLAGEEGLRIVAGAEEAGTNPGSEVLEQMLLATGGPALILLDEIVAYVRQLGGERYEANLAFFQSLTEAATRVPHALVVGSLPQSEDEAGGDRGRETLERLERLFGRLQSSWQAAQGAETYAIVRRRLFEELDAKGVAERDKTIDAYRRLYRENKRDFPGGVDETTYADLMREAYPVHPILFDKLAQEWGSLDRFQRTRGVLKFIAESARRIWLSRADDPLIQPGHIPLGDPAVRGSITESLEGPAWGAIVDGEVESDRAIPVLLDTENRRFGDGRFATRAARAVFLGTAPRADARGGMSPADVRLACVVPGENLSVFGDALAAIAERAGHLYTDGSAYWYGPQPTLRKLAESRAQQLSDEDADDAVVELLRGEERMRGGFARVHTCPANPEEADDSYAVALVVLNPHTPHDPRVEGSAAMAAAEDALKRRSGGGLRHNRNTLIFVAADANALGEARRAAKLMLAWRSIRDDRNLDLKDSQRTDATRQAEQSASALSASVHRTWQHAIMPIPRAVQDGEPFDLKRVPVRAAAGKSVAQSVWERVRTDSDVFEKLGVVTLTDRLDKSWPAGADYVPLDTIRDWFAQYVAFERLRDESVLADALSELLSDHFAHYAYADGVNSSGGYAGLHLAGRVITPRFDGASVLVTEEAAARASGEPAPKKEPRDPVSPPPAGPGGVEDPEPPRALRRFYGTVELDPTRAIRDMQAIVDSVVAELMRADGARVTLRLDIEATAPDGFATDDAAVVRDNAKTLKFKPEDTGFSEN